MLNILYSPAKKLPYEDEVVEPEKNYLANKVEPSATEPRQFNGGLNILFISKRTSLIKRKLLSQIGTELSSEQAEAISNRSRDCVMED